MKGETYKQSDMCTVPLPEAIKVHKSTALKLWTCRVHGLILMQPQVPLDQVMTGYLFVKQSAQSASRLYSLAP